MLDVCVVLCHFIVFADLFCYSALSSKLSGWPNAYFALFNMFGLGFHKSLRNRPVQTKGCMHSVLTLKNNAVKVKTRKIITIDLFGN